MRRLEMANNGPRSEEQQEPTPGLLERVQQHTGLSTAAWVSTAEHLIHQLLVTAYLVKSASSGHLNELDPQQTYFLSRGGSPALRAASPAATDDFSSRSRSPRPSS
jgi:hypothetical protein